MSKNPLKDQSKEEAWYFPVLYPQHEGVSLSQMIVFGACVYQKTKHKTLAKLSTLTNISPSQVLELSNTLVEVGLLEDKTYEPIFKEELLRTCRGGLYGKWEYFTYFQPSQYSVELATNIGYKPSTFSALYSWLISHSSSALLNYDYIAGRLQIGTGTTKKYMNYLEYYDLIKVKQKGKKFEIGRNQPNLDFFSLRPDNDDVGIFDTGKIPEKVDTAQALKDLGKTPEPATPPEAAPEPATPLEERVDLIKRIMIGVCGGNWMVERIVKAAEPTLSQTEEEFRERWDNKSFADLEEYLLNRNGEQVAN
jgi:hypothetical protein